MFTVEWTENAAAALEELLFTGDVALRSQIGDAIVRIERQLATAPTAFGESRDDEDRVGFEQCIGLDFSVHLASKRVLIYRVWLLRRH